MDIRNKKLAENLINYSVELKENEKIIIITGKESIDLAVELVNAAYDVGGMPFVQLVDDRLRRVFLRRGSAAQFEQLAQWELYRLKDVDARIIIVPCENANELCDVPGENMHNYNLHYRKPYMEESLKKKWCGLNYPTPALAQAAGMSQEAFTDFYYKVCCLDYAKMGRALKPLIKLMDETDKVRITGRDTDLSFSVKGINTLACAGKRNIPDGEAFTAPVKNSVNGKISFNTPTVYEGVNFENICLEFDAGKIVRATANDSKKLNEILDTDEGSRYIGEFALGVNPYIEKPMKDILFDEKIAGSFHFTPGNCYKNGTDNGNSSAIHWDMVCIQTPQYGGGEMYFDDVLVRKDGLFVLPELEVLNPENLKSIR